MRLAFPSSFLDTIRAKGLGEVSTSAWLRVISFIKFHPSYL